MARIAGVDLPREKRVEIGLTYIYGIGRPTANKILEETGIDPDIRVKDLTEAQVSLIRDYIEKIFMSRATSKGSRAQHQASYGNRLLQGYPSQKGSPRPRSEHQTERPYEKGSQTYRRPQEERQITEA